MINLIIDDYKLQLFLFEKMGSRSIEDAINDKVGDHEWEGIILRDIHRNSASRPDGMEIEGGILKYRKYDGRITESYLDEGNQAYAIYWPKDYKRILVYRNAYHRVVSTFYHQLNARGKNKEGWSDEHGRGAWDVQYKELDILPKSENLEDHIKSFHNFCKLHFYSNSSNWVDGVFYGKTGHMAAIWEQIPKYLMKDVDEVISLDDVNNNKLVEILEKYGVPNQKLEEFTKSLNKNKEYYSKQKSQMEDSDQHLRQTNNYEKFYDTMDNKILTTITEFYKTDLELTGVKPL